ncbi:MAG: hypothetical protein KAJ03_05645 [Gammaproteobacteria bacterium]|nr:hypothetical protein [Gammaproteobacteria bacterium]
MIKDDIDSVDVNESLVKLYEAHRRDGELFDDIKISHAVHIHEHELEYTDVIKRSKIRMMLNEIMDVAIKFPDDTLHTRYVEHVRHVAGRVPNQTVTEIHMTYYVFSGLRYTNGSCGDTA